MPQAATPASTKVEQEERATRIVAHMTVVDDKGARVGAVDRVEGTARSKLTKDGQGRHHHIPLGWAARVDTQVHLDRPVKACARHLRPDSRAGADTIRDATATVARAAGTVDRAARCCATAGGTETSRRADSSCYIVARRRACLA